MITIALNQHHHLYLGQRVAAQIDYKYYIGNIVFFNSEKEVLFVSVIFDIGVQRRYNENDVYPVEYFSTNKQGVDFSKLSITTLSPVQLFSQNYVDINFGAETLSGLWSYINHYVFDSELPSIRVMVEDIDSYAKFKATYDTHKAIKPETAKIIVGTKVRRPVEVLIALSHEMVHQYQAMVSGLFVNGPEAHDDSFFVWSDKVSSVLGVQLTETGSFIQTRYVEYGGSVTYYILLKQSINLHTGMKRYTGAYSTHLSLVHKVYDKRVETDPVNRYLIVKTNDVNVPSLVDDNKITEGVVNSWVSDVLFDSSIN